MFCLFCWTSSPSVLWVLRDHVPSRLQGCNINFFFGEGEATCPGIIPASLVGGSGDDDDDDDGGQVVYAQPQPAGTVALDSKLFFIIAAVYAYSRMCTKTSTGS